MSMRNSLKYLLVIIIVTLINSGCGLTNNPWFTYSSPELSLSISIPEGWESEVIPEALILAENQFMLDYFSNSDNSEDIPEQRMIGISIDKSSKTELGSTDPVETIMAFEGFLTYNSYPIVYKTEPYLIEDSDQQQSFSIINTEIDKVPATIILSAVDSDSYLYFLLGIAYFPIDGDTNILDRAIKSVSIHD